MIAFKTICEDRFSRTLSSKGLFLKSPNNIKPLKPDPGHISVRPRVQQITAEHGYSQAFPESPAWPPLRASRLPRQLVIVAVVGRLGGADWRTITQSQDAGRFIATRSIIRAMIITGPVNSRLQNACPPVLSLSASNHHDFAVTSDPLQEHPTSVCSQSS